MTHANQPRRKLGQRPVLHAVVFLLAMLSIALNGANARATDRVPSGVRVAKAFSKFDDVWQYAATYRLRPPRRLHSHHLELAVGAFTSPSESQAFVSLGPVWRFRPLSRALFLELGFSPTLLSGSTLNGRELGGNLHFTSSATLGTTFGARDEYGLALRIQHTSNGGLHSSNPGLDAIALNFTFDLSN